jgi:hypothetical protein
MYRVLIETPTSFSAKLIGEFENLDDAEEKAFAEKEKNPDVTWIIEETSGGFNSYGELLSTEIERG